MKEYHPPLGGREGLRLDFNENSFECSPEVLRVLRAVGTEQLTRYPERGAAEEIAARHLGLEPEQVLLTNGVDEAIHVLCQTYLDEGDEVLLPVPTYAMYEVYASATAARIVKVQADEGFRFPLERLLGAIHASTRLIVVANPNSPTGSVVSRDEILRIVTAAPQAMVLVDEAYFHFFGGTVAGLLGQYPNLLLTRTFSKAYGLAGLRLGLLAGPAESVSWMRRVISPYSVNSIALACLSPALNDAIYLDWYVGEVLAARAQLSAALDEIGMKYWPSEANFILVNIGMKHAEFTDRMKKRGVLVRDRSADPGCAGCVRITVGIRTQTIVAIQTLKSVLDGIGWKAEGISV